MKAADISLQNSFRNNCREALDQISSLIQKAEPENNSLFDGKLCQAVYFAYLFELDQASYIKDLAIGKLEEVLDDFNSGQSKTSGISYAGGYAGLLYAITIFLQKKWIDKSFLNETGDLAKLLAEEAINLMENNYNDPIHGSFGVFHTLLFYSRVTGNTDAAKRLWKHIQEKQLLEGKLWINSFVSGKEEIGTINFGFAHGQCGLIRVVLEAVELFGIDAKKKALLQANINYLLSFKKEKFYDNSCNLFPSRYNTGNGIADASPRLAWCYGDLGPLITLTAAGKILDMKLYREEAQKLGLQTTKRTTEKETAVHDTYLCHGTAGLANIYGFLASSTGNKDYQQACIYWMERTLTILPEFLNASNKNLHSNLALGLPGVGLTFMSCLSERTIHWEHLMLL